MNAQCGLGDTPLAEVLVVGEVQLHMRMLRAAMGPQVGRQHAEPLFLAPTGRSVYDLVHKTGLWALSLLDSVLWREGLGLVYPGSCYWFPNGFCLATSCCCSSSVEMLGQWQWGFTRWLNHLNAPCLFPVAPSVPRFAACSICAPLVVPVNACKVVIKDLVQYMVLWGVCFC